MKRKPIIVKANSKVAKYYVAKRAGKNGKEALAVAGYSPTQQSRVEKSVGYQQLQRRYKDVLQDQISMDEIVTEHRKVIQQDEQLGPKVAAIKIAMDSIEPEPPKEDDGSEKVFVVLR